MKYGQLVQMVRDVGGFSVEQYPVERIGAVSNLALRHVAALCKYPRFCLKGPLYPHRVVYRTDQLDFKIADVDRMIVRYNEQDKALQIVAVQVIQTAYSTYDLTAREPDNTWVAESESASPMSMKFSGWELRAPSGQNPNGALLTWLRPPSNEYVANGLWLFGVQALEIFSNNDTVIPLLEVHQNAAVQFAVWTLSDKPGDLTRYKELEQAALRYRPGRGDIPIPILLKNW